MQLKVLGSSSKGNCYILENESEALLIECGVNFKVIKSGLDFNLSKVRACIISHEHKDHCFAVKDILAAGIATYGTAGTGKAIGVVDHHRYNSIVPGKSFEAGGFKILPFETQHDCAEPCCFLINHEECGNVLFLTDTYYSAYTFRGLNQVIVEANYCQKIIDAKVAAGVSPQFLRNRILSSHMSLATCKNFLKANDLSAVQNIVLIHLSDSNSDASRFRDEVAAATGKPVQIADAGLIIENFNKGI